MFKVKTSYIFYVLSIFLLTQNIYAVGASGVRVSHCTTNCGKILVGAVRIDMSGIQWQGFESTGVLLSLSGARENDLLGSRVYGFTGSFDSDGAPNANLMEYTTPISNKWFFVSAGEASIANPAANSKSPSLGFYFSPLEVKSYSSGNSYSAYSGAGTYYQPENVQLLGEGVADNISTPALTLDVKVDGQTSSQSDITVNSNSSTTFTLTPKLDATHLPTDVPQPKYTEVLIKIDEVGTNCKSSLANPSFTDLQETPNDFTANSYYHYLTLEKYQQGKCSRIYYYLVSIDRAFTFKATAQNSTANGYVQYLFFIKGHYDTITPIETAYPGSHHTFRLRTSNVTTPTTNKLTVKVTGNGTVISNDNKINCPTNNCSSDYNVNTPVTLTATSTNNNSTVEWKSCGTIDSSKNQAIITMDAAKTCTVTFSSDTVPVPSDNIELTLKVNPVQAGTVKAKFANSEITAQGNPIDVPKDSKVIITATPNEGYRFKEWLTTDGNVVISNNNLTTSIGNDGVGTLIINQLTTEASSYTAVFEANSTLSMFKVTHEGGNSYYFDALGLDSISSATLEWTAVYSDGTKVLWENDSSDTRTEISFHHTFDKSATVTLKTKMNGKETTYESYEIKVNQLPVAKFKLDQSKTETTIDVQLDASDSESNSGTGITEYRWSSSNGTVTCNESSKDCSKASIIFSIANYKSESIKLIVVDDVGESEPYSQVVTINKQLIKEIVPTPRKVLLPSKDPLTLEAILFDEAQNCVYRWSTTSGLNIRNSALSKVETNLAKEGSYDFDLLVDCQSGSDTKSITVKAIKPMPPIAEISVSQKQDENNSYSYFLLDSSSSYDPDALEEDKNTEITTYLWEKDENCQGSLIPNNTPSETPTATLSFVGLALSEDQSCTVTLTVTDNENSKSTASVVTLPTVKTPTAGFTSFPANLFTEPLIIGPNAAYAGDIYLDASKLSSDPDGVIQNYSWEIKNGDESIIIPSPQTSVITLSSLVSGNYTVKLTVTDNYGLTNSIEKNFIILPPLLGGTVQINPNGTESPALALSYGGVIVDDKFLVGKDIGVNSSNEITVVAGMKVDKHVDQRADIIAVIGVLDQTSGVITFFNFVAPPIGKTSYLIWNGDIATLQPLHKDTLSSTINETVFQGNFASYIGSGTFNITVYLGYRLSTGEIITNLYSPLTFGINPN